MNSHRNALDGGEVHELALQTQIPLQEEELKIEETTRAIEGCHLKLSAPCPFAHEREAGCSLQTAIEVLFEGEALRGEKLRSSVAPGIEHNQLAQPILHTLQ